jgi:hypothetical protein
MNKGNSDQRASNKRTGLVMATIALAFFCGVMIKKVMLG